MGIDSHYYRYAHDWGEWAAVSGMRGGPGTPRSNRRLGSHAKVLVPASANQEEGPTFPVSSFLKTLDEWQGWGLLSAARGTGSLGPTTMCLPRHHVNPRSGELGKSANERCSGLPGRARLARAREVFGPTPSTCPGHRRYPMGPSGAVGVSQWKVYAPTASYAVES